MAKLVPLFQDGADEVERLLLEAARQDGPPDGSGRAKTLAALKALGPAGAVGGAAVAAGWKWGHVFGWVGGKWIVVGVLAAGAVTTGSVIVGLHPPASVRHASGAGAPASDVPAAAVARPTGKGPEIAAPSQPSTASPRPSPATSTESRVGSAAAMAGRVDRRSPDSAVAARAASSGVAIHEASPAAQSAFPLGTNLAAPTAAAPAESVTAAPAESVAASPTPPSAQSAARPRTSLRDETALLESVRASLARSSVADALASLARYDARFPSGKLVDEAAVLRVEALMAAGRRDEARQSAEKFAQSHPQSPYAGRMLTLLRR